MRRISALLPIRTVYRNPFICFLQCFFFSVLHEMMECTAHETRALHNSHLAFVKCEFHEHISSNHPHHSRPLGAEKFELYGAWECRSHSSKWKNVWIFFCSFDVFRRTRVFAFNCVRESFWLRTRKIAPNYLWVIHLVPTQFFSNS